MAFHCGSGQNGLNDKRHSDTVKRNYHVEKGLRAAFASESTYPVELDVEHADRSRFPEEALLHKLVELYRYKYSKRKMDLVIAMGGKAPELLLACGKDLFGDIPVVVISSNPKYLLNELKQFNVTPLLWGFDIKKTVKIIQDVRPQTKNLFVVSGVSIGDENLYTRTMEVLSENAAALHIESLKDLAIGNLLERVRNLPNDSAILFTSYFRDAAGQSFVPRDILSTISESANAPIFGAMDTYLGHGIVGGSLLSAEYQGKRLGNIAVELLKGEPINAAEATTRGNQPMFDWRKLRRWGISENRLPEGSILLHREASFFERYFWPSIGIMVFIILQAALITRLVILNRRRKVMHRKVREAEGRYRELLRIDRSARLGEMAGSLAHELNQPLTAILSSAQAALRFLKAGHTESDQIREILEHIVNDDKRAASIISGVRATVRYIIS